MVAAYVTNTWHREKTPLPQCQQKPHFTPQCPVHASPPTHTYEPEVPQYPELKCQKSIDFSSFKNPSHPPKWFVLSEGEPTTKAKVGWPISWNRCHPAIMIASSGVSRLLVRHNEGVWSPAGRETQSIEKLDFFFIVNLLWYLCPCVTL